MKLFPLFMAVCLTFSCAKDNRIDVIFDTDANNELDDQHAIAYMLLNPETFNVKGITTNVTINGTIQDQCDEVFRVASLVGDYGKDVKILPGATESFEQIRGKLSEDSFDGVQAVDFIINTAKKYSGRHKLTLVPVGKLTNVALALEKDPSIAGKLRIVWLGSNYPADGEHNLKHDIPAMNYILDTDVQFEMLVCRYGEETGTSAVKIHIDEVRDRIAGKGPKAAHPVTGRHSGEFTCFGDYSLNLFQNIQLSATGTRSMFDMCTLAIIKNPSWGHTQVIPAPTMVDGHWVERPDNKRTITVWEKFDSAAIISDFISSLDR